VNLRGGYATASYMLTGETRYYYVDEGEIGAPEEPKSKWGALELAARFSYTNLNDIPAGIKVNVASVYVWSELLSKYEHKIAIQLFNT
jgi:phosphate-selective porin